MSHLEAAREQFGTVQDQRGARKKRIRIVVDVYFRVEVRKEKKAGERM